MKIYVDEMPKDCWECPCAITNGCSEGVCKLYWLQNKYEDDLLVSYGQKVPRDCPLQSLAEHDKEARKQVVEEIKSKVKELIDNKDFGLCNHEYANGFCYGLQYELAKILDQVEKENGDEINND